MSCPLCIPRVQVWEKLCQRTSVLNPASLDAGCLRGGGCGTLQGGSTGGERCDWRANRSLRYSNRTLILYRAIKYRKPLTIPVLSHDHIVTAATPPARILPCQGHPRAPPPAPQQRRCTCACRAVRATDMATDRSAFKIPDIRSVISRSTHRGSCCPTTVDTVNTILSEHAAIPISEATEAPSPPLSAPCQLDEDQDASIGSSNYTCSKAPSGV